MKTPSINAVFTTVVDEKVHRLTLELTIEDTEDTIKSRLADHRGCSVDDLTVEDLQDSLPHDKLFALCAKVVDFSIHQEISQLSLTAEGKTLEFAEGTADTLFALSTQFNILIESKADLTSITYPIVTASGVQDFKGSYLLNILGQLYTEQNKIRDKFSKLLQSISKETLTSLEQCKAFIEGKPAPSPKGKSSKSKNKRKLRK